MIYTSYYANLVNLPKGIIPISIALNSPSYYKGVECKELAPTPNIHNQWMLMHDEDKFTNDFILYLMSKDIKTIIDNLLIKYKGKDICLICYEIPEYFCHRHIIGKILNNLGYKCEEYK